MEDHEITYEFEGFYFHCLVAKGIVYHCVSSTSFGQRIPFHFLKRIRELFEESYSQRLQDAAPYSMQPWNPTLAHQMKTFSQANIDDTKQVEDNPFSKIEVSELDNPTKEKSWYEPILPILSEQDHLTGQPKPEWRLSNIRLWAFIGVLFAAVLILFLMLNCGRTNSLLCDALPPGSYNTT